MADAAAADCVGNSPLREQRGAAPSSISLPSNKTSLQASLPPDQPSLRRHQPDLHHHRPADDDNDNDDVASVARSTSAAGGRAKSVSAASPKTNSLSKSKFGSKDKDKSTAKDRDRDRDRESRESDKHEQATGSDQHLRKSASASTTASARTNTSTEVRAAISNRASRSALTRQSVSPTSSPTISFSSWHEVEPDTHYPPHHQLHQAQGFGITYSSPIPDSTSESSSSPRLQQSQPPVPSGIVQVNPAPSPSPPPPPPPPPQTRGRPQMAAAFIPSFFGRRRPTSSASSVQSANFAAANPPPPGAAAFDFNSILNSLDSDTAAQADIDAIAEICGRSRLSLANAHSNHRGPVGELTGTDDAPSNMLETVRESGTPGREEDRSLSGSRAGSAAGEQRWQRTGPTETYEQDRETVRGAVSGVIAYGTSPRTEEEGRARRHLMRVRDVSNEREQRRQRR